MGAFIGIWVALTKCALVGAGERVLVDLRCRRRPADSAITAAAPLIVLLVRIFCAERCRHSFLRPSGWKHTAAAPY